MYSRSGSGGYGRDVEGGGRFNDANTNILEQQNNDRISELSEQVARLKVNFDQAIATRMTCLYDDMILASFYSQHHFRFSNILSIKP